MPCIRIYESYNVTKNPIVLALILMKRAVEACVTKFQKRREKINVSEADGYWAYLGDTPPRICPGDHFPQEILGVQILVPRTGSEGEKCWP